MILQIVARLEGPLVCMSIMGQGGLRVYLWLRDVDVNQSRESNHQKHWVILGQNSDVIQTDSYNRIVNPINTFATLINSATKFQQV